MGEVHQHGLGWTFTIDMEFRVGGLIDDLCECLDRYIQSLVPVQRSGIHHDEFAVRPGSGVGIKITQVRIIADGRALFAPQRSRDEALVPKVVGNDHVMGKSRRPFLHAPQQPEHQG